MGKCLITCRLLTWFTSVVSLVRCRVKAEKRPRLKYIERKGMAQQKAHGNDFQSRKRRLAVQERTKFLQKGIPCRKLILNRTTIRRGRDMRCMKIEK